MRYENTYQVDGFPVIVRRSHGQYDFRAVIGHEKFQVVCWSYSAEGQFKERTEVIQSMPHADYSRNMTAEEAKTLRRLIGAALQVMEDMHILGLDYDKKADARKK